MTAGFETMPCSRSSDAAVVGSIDTPRGGCRTSFTRRLSAVCRSAEAARSTRLGPSSCGRAEALPRRASSASRVAFNSLPLILLPMASTLAQIEKQIEELQRQAETLKRQEVT